MATTRETADRILKEMSELDDTFDTELAHVEADNLLCEMLTVLGYDEIVEAYAKIGKWYA